MPRVGDILGAAWERLGGAGLRERVEAVPAPGKRGKAIVVGESFVGRALRAGGAPAPDWCSEEGPAQAQRLIDKAGVGAEMTFLDIFGFYSKDGKNAVPDWFIALWGGPPGGLGQTVLFFFYFPLWSMDALWSIFPAPKGCSKQLSISLAVGRSILGFAERWLGIVATLPRTQMQLLDQYACPTEIPSVVSIATSYLRGRIDSKEADGWLRANGLCDFARTLVLDEQEREHSVGELITLYRRGIIVDKETLRERLKYWGWRTAEQVDELLELSRPLLGIGTITDAIHVLREGRVDADLVYSRDDADNALERLGYSESDRARLIYLMDRIPPHRQYVQDFERGRITEDQLVQAMLDEGLREPTINALMELYKHVRIRTLATESGRPSAATLVRSRAAGDLSADQFATGLGHLDLSSDELSEAVSAAEDAGAAEKARRGIAASRSAYLAGEHDRSEAVADLGAYGVDPDTAGQIVDTWELDAAVRRRPDSPAAMCTWVKQGLIQVQDFRRRLMLQGYTPLQAANIVSSCALKELEREQMAAQKAASAAEKKAVADATKAERQAKQQAKAVEALRKAKAQQLERSIREDIGEIGREAREIHTAEHAAESAELAEAKADQPGKSGQPDPLKVAAAEIAERAAETLPESAGPAPDQTAAPTP